MTNKQDSLAFAFAFVEEKKIPQIKQVAIEKNTQNLVILGAYRGLDQLTVWLDQKRERRVVLFDEDLGKLKSFQHQKLASHPRFTMHLVQSFAEMQNTLLTLPLGYPQVLSKDKKNSLHAQVLEQMYLINAYASDILQPEKYFQNMYANLHTLSRSFDALNLKSLSNKPAFIFGSGPSLNVYVKHFSKLQNRGFIFAAGSSATILSKKQLMPHLCFVVDPNPEQVQTLCEMQCPDSSVVFTLRANPKALQLFKKDTFYIPFATEDPRENYIDKSLNLSFSDFQQSNSAYSTAGLFALQYALKMKMDPIYLFGFDLQFCRGKLYGEGLEDLQIDGEQIGEKLVEIDGEKSILKWQLEKSVFEHLSEKSSTIFRLPGGLKSSRIPTTTINEVLALPQFQPDKLLQKHIDKALASDVQTFLNGLKDELLEMTKILSSTMVHELEKKLALHSIEKFSCYESFFAQLLHFSMLQLPKKSRNIDTKLSILKRAVSIHIELLQKNGFFAEDLTSLP